MIDRVARFELWETLALSWLFLGLHTALSWIEWRRWGARPWWRTALGWILASAVGSLGVVVAFPAAASIWPVLVTHDWYLWAYVASFQAVAAATAAKLVWRIRAHARARKVRESTQGDDA